MKDIIRQLLAESDILSAAKKFGYKTYTGATMPPVKQTNKNNEAIMKILNGMKMPTKLIQVKLWNKKTGADFNTAIKVALVADKYIVGHDRNGFNVGMWKSGKPIDKFDNANITSVVKFLQKKLQ